MEETFTNITRALISVSDKTGIVELARGLSELGIEIVSTGGTAKLLEESGIKAISVSHVTGFPEMMDGRVKTLHPKVHGGILARRDNPQDMREAEEQGIGMIDLVVVNLYPFEETILRPEASLEDAIENIDIGGPTLIRSAAKNYRHVGVLTDAEDYGAILDELKTTRELSDSTREMLSVKAFRTTADYDAAVEGYLSEKLGGEKILRLKYTGGVQLRYGENWHQSATFYRDDTTEESSIAHAVQLHGKEMSYNNYMDADAALEALKELKHKPAAAFVKHTNPCGYATGEALREAVEAAWNGDRMSLSAGSILAVSRAMDLDTAEFLAGRFIDIIAAPGYEDEALKLLKSRRKNLILLNIPSLSDAQPCPKSYRHITGGILEQGSDVELFQKFVCVTEEGFPEEKKELALFALKAVKHTKSNAMVICEEYRPGGFQVLGMGAGQPNRVDSFRKLAATKAQENLRARFEEEAKTGNPENYIEDYIEDKMKETVMASDSFFFPDTVEYASKEGIRYIVQPGGSIHDKECIQACEQAGVSMVFTGTRHFLH